MKKFTMAMVLATAALVGCESTSLTQGQSAMSNVSQAELENHNWVLEKINGETITVMDGLSAPNLEVKENFAINGNNGCNRYFGQGELQGAQFRVDKMGSTMMACPPDAMELESAMTSVLTQWSDIQLTAEKRLVLKNDSYTLDFVLTPSTN